MFLFVEDKYIPTNICGIICVITIFSLSSASGVDGGAGDRSSGDILSFKHSIKSGYSVLTASKPPKIK